ncbi:MAG: hypothetical protein ACE145_14230 [Terriglobia bacterium]
MNREHHERALQLVDARAVEGLSAADQEWLESHLDACAGCSAYAESVGRTLESLRWMPVELDPAVVAAARARVRLRARELREQESRMQGLWIACVLSWVMGVLSAPLVWWGFQWIGRHMALPDLAWQTAFVLWWVMPAAAAAAVLAGLRARAAKENGIQESLRR